MRTLIVFLSTMLALSSQASLLRPDPAAGLSEISGFEADWCSQLTSHPQQFPTVCYGVSRFQAAQNVRSIVVVRAGGERNLYIEDGWPAVDILKPAFNVVGPVYSDRVSELGRARVFFDKNGEVEEITVFTISIGQLRARRP